MRRPDPTLLLVLFVISGATACFRVLIASEQPQLEPVAQGAGPGAQHGAGAVTRTGWSGRAPFRPGRRPASIAYSATPEPSRGRLAHEPAGPRPQLVLRGLVTGKVRMAIVEGFPGIEGARAVRSGDTVGALRVVRIDKEQVRIAGPDTVWQLGMRGAQ